MSDIVVGAIIGISAVIHLEISCLGETVGIFVSKLEKRWSGLFYVAFFVLSNQTVTLFDDNRKVSFFLFHHIK